MPLENILKYKLVGGVYLALLTLFVYYPKNFFPHILPQIIIFQSLIEILFAAYLVLIVFYPQYRPRSTFILWTFIFLILVLMVAGWFGSDWQFSLWSIPERGLGIFALFHFLALFLILASLYKFIDWKKFLTFAFLISLIIALLALDTGNRPGGLLGNPNFLSAYLLFNLFIGLWLMGQTINKYHRWLLGGGMVLQTGLIFLTQTRGALLGLVIGMLVYLSLMAYLSKKRWLWLIVLGLVGLSLFFLFARQLPFWQSVPGASRFLGRSVEELGVAPRIGAWQAAWSGFQERPLLGWGWENFEKVFNKNFPAELLVRDEADQFFSKPHNIFLEYLVTSGELGLLAFALLIGSYFYQLFKTKNNYRIAAFSGLMAAYLVQGFFSLDVFSTYLMLVITLAFINE